MNQEQAARHAPGSPDGSAGPSADAEGEVIKRRRRTDWTGEESAQVAAYRAGVEVAAAALAVYDGPTADHSDDVVEVSDAIAEMLRVTGVEREQVKVAARLHDIGKVGIPADVLTKPGPLTDDEWVLVRRHTVEGERILAAVPEMEGVAQIVRHTHERFDGAGYPDGLRGEEIPLPARIIFCADAFHAIRSDRPYRRGRPAREALAEIEAGAGSQFDPAVTTALCEVASGMRSNRRSGVAALVAGARSRRLAALLLTLAIGGSALAATGELRSLPVIPDGGSDSAAPACQGPGCSPADLGTLGELPRPNSSPPVSERRSAPPTKAGKGSAAKRSGSATSPRSVRRSPAASPDAPGRAPVRGNGNGKALGRRGLAPGHTKARPPKPAKKPKQQTPGRSEAAPGKPDGKVKHGGGSPGRSGEAPGKPDGPGKFGQDR